MKELSGMIGGSGQREGCIELQLQKGCDDQ